MAVRVVAAKLAGMSESWVRGWAKKATRALLRSRDDMSVVFVSAGEMRRLNREYRGKDKPTDVLSFAFAEKGELGDIFIAPSVATAKAVKRGQDYKSYLALLIVHSVLHLGGFDHRTKKEAGAMARMEKKIL
jgi:probable rRNA maturation factor